MYKLKFLTLALAVSFAIHAQTSGSAFNLPACAGDSAIDDTPILWDAMSLASSNVFFLSPARVCHVNFVGRFSLPAGIKLVGTNGRSVLQPFDAAKSLAVLRNPNITFEGLTLDAGAPAISGTQNTLVFVINTTGIGMVNNSFLSSAHGGTSSGNAVWFYNSSGRIQDNDFSSFQNQILVRAGVGIDPVVSITNNRLHDNSTAGGNAISLSNNGGRVKVDLGVVVEGNTIQNIHASGSSSGQNGNGVDIYLANHVRVSNNHVSNVSFSCYRSASSDDAIFTANYCLNAGESAAYSEFTAQHNQWLNNYFEGAHGACLNLTNLDVGGQLHTAIGNHMLRCGSSGIHAEGNAIIAGNTIDQSKSGITVGYGQYGMNVLVKDNLITDMSGNYVTQFGIGVEDGATAGVEIEGNRIALGGICITGTSYGIPSISGNMPAALTIRNQALPYTMLGAAANGSFVYCPNCRIGEACEGPGTGAFAKRVAGRWSCE